MKTRSPEELLATLGLEEAAATIARDPHATIEPNRSADAVGIRALRELADVSSGRTLSRGLELRDTIGEGGMGVVRLAMQASLGREVAVKTLKSALSGEAAVLRLVREAWVTGSLEHPNIVPVYDLALDESGLPIIVMRRIQGVGWDRLMHAPDEIARRFGATDPLEWNLSIFVRVTSAVALAHSRDIIHRDLKPENVMIGAFGEVYVVDWGVAVSLEDDPAGRLPTSSSDVAGTPAYMAPEMFGASDAPLSARSDVYLLGGILHEILTGNPPHPTGSLPAMVASAMLSKFAFPESAPRPLVEIAERALAAEPDARFASVTELQQRVEWYLRHRGSVALAAEAAARADDVRDAIAAGDHERAHRLFAECRFGYRAALRASAENEDAIAGLRRVTEEVVRFDLARGAPASAAAALAELTSPPDDLRAAVDGALRAQKRDEERLRKLQRDQDETIGRRTRRAVVLLLGALWAAAPWLARWLEQRYATASLDTQYRASMLWTGTVGLLSIGVGYWARESMLRTALNRRVLGAVVCVFAAQFAAQMGAHLMGLPLAQAITLYVLVWFVITAVASVVIDRRILPVALIYLIAFLAICAMPDRKWPLISGANGALGLMLAFAWRGKTARA